MKKLNLFSYVQIALIPICIFAMFFSNSNILAIASNAILMGILSYTLIKILNSKKKKTVILIIAMAIIFLVAGTIIILNENNTNNKSKTVLVTNRDTAVKFSVSHMEWYGGTFDVSLKELDSFKNLPHLSNDMQAYLCKDTSLSIKNAVYKIDSLCNKYGDLTMTLRPLQTAQFIYDFIEHNVHQYDSHEGLKYPIQTLAYGGNAKNCCVLFSEILTCLGYANIIVNEGGGDYYVGLEITDEAIFDAANYSHRGKKYYLYEWTQDNE